MIRLSSSMILLVCALVGGCRHHGGVGGDEPDAEVAPPDACNELGCFIVDCAAKGQPSTSVSGTVYAPNGTLPLYGVNVYVPASDPGPLTDGVVCDQCVNGVQGGAYAQTKTDEAGKFHLEGVPATANVPLVIQVGKWRRQLVLPNVAACQDVALDGAQTTLPKNHTEGDLPQIAITTGAADALECLVRKLGIDDTEITTDAQGGRVHLFANTTIGGGEGAKEFAAGFGGGTGAFSDAQTLWGNLDTLKKYDIVLFSCEGGQYPATKPQSAMDAVSAFADLGGRVFMSHWHNIWVGGEQGNPDHGIADWEAVGTFNYGAAQDQEQTIATVDQTVDKGVSFATWLMNVGASTTLGQIPINGARYTLASNDATKSDRRVYLDPALSNDHVSVQDLQFTTPQSVPEDQRCGKVVFSDMHVSSGSSSNRNVPYPGGCAMTELSPQEKALAFIFFDISSCVGVLQ